MDVYTRIQMFTPPHSDHRRWLREVLFLRFQQLLSRSDVTDLISWPPIALTRYECERCFENIRYYPFRTQLAKDRNPNYLRTEFATTLWFWFKAPDSNPEGKHIRKRVCIPHCERVARGIPAGTSFLLMARDLMDMVQISWNILPYLLPKETKAYLGLSVGLRPFEDMIKLFQTNAYITPEIIKGAQGTLIELDAVDIIDFEIGIEISIAFSELQRDTPPSDWMQQKPIMWHELWQSVDEQEDNGYANGIDTAEVSSAEIRRKNCAEFSEK